MGFMDRFKQGMDAAQQAQQQAATPGGGFGMPDAAQMGAMNAAVRLNQVGVEQPATIKSIDPTGNVDPGGGMEHRITVDVEPAGGAPYEATFTQFMHMQTMGSWATPGAQVNVKVDPDNPQLMLLWGGRQ